MRTLTFIILLLCAPLSRAADARVITEGTTNVLCIGIDSRDFDVIRFYLRGTNTLELRATQVWLKDQPINPPKPDAKTALEREAIMSALSLSTNVSALNTSTVLSNIVRLRLIEDVDETGKPKK